MHNRLQFQVKLGFLVAFFFIAAGLWFYQINYVRPAQECEENGQWWYRPGRQCLTPVRITDLTGRHMDDPDLTGTGRRQGPPQWRPLGAPDPAQSAATAK
jgi:hypothetical protein